LTLRAFCEERGIPYADVGLPVPLKVFVEYGLEFQKRFVPHLERKELVSLLQAGDGFHLQLSTGEAIDSRKVVVAVGIRHFRYIPPIFDGLPADVVSHSGDHHRLEQFKGRNVTVIGGGSSASDLAALLVESGADARLLTRRAVLEFGDPMKLPRSLGVSLRYPMSPIGPGWHQRFCADAPWLFRLLPENTRVRAVRRMLGPSGGWFMRQRCERACLMRGFEVIKVDVDNQKRVLLQLSDRNGARRQLHTDHVIAATGYRPNLDKLQFIQPGLRGRIRSLENAPVLSSNFESSVRGLYFVGPASQVSFGPLMRFACGAKFTARRISRHLAATAPAQRTKVLRPAVAARGTA